MDLSRLSSHVAEAVTDAERQAAVVAPVLVRDDEDHVLFTKRADHLGEHPGQMSFPGGGREPSDDSLRATALREADEEIGLRASEVDFFGRLDDIRTVTDYSVTPFVARIPDRTYDPDEREVAEIVALAESDLTDYSNYESEHRDHPHYGPIRLHFFRADGYTVWGATARMLVQLLELTTEWEMPPEPDRVVDPDADYPV
ncbi:NUDIX domain-containing protein [Halopelagius inordinatus]|uniref:NUDIX domain-containing protein n=1 Tax=Halopelagius inordinatus TaxID=553467 RepID=A0A1I2MN12_9EURY|nr:CoA pyrophosphatase [Halopelagius inordinatus]SFF92832.1 NUDIX domain-containing protein [Halopelagius inordinatus]